MVYLRRAAEPPMLRARNVAWTKRWQEIHAGRKTGDWKPPSARLLLSEELRKLTFGKCAFCEGLLEVTSYLEIEHYIPKTVRPDLVFEWTNLFPICRWCNNAKGDADHAGMLLKPDVDDPEPMLWLHPDTGKLEPRRALETEVRRRVEQTIELCDLQRGRLCTKRIETMQFTIRWLERVSHRPGPAGSGGAGLPDEPCHRV